MAKVIIYSQDHEKTALNDLAQSEYRAPKAQVALISRRELERKGLIEIVPANGQAKQVCRKASTLDNPIRNRSLTQSGKEIGEA